MTFRRSPRLLAIILAATAVGGVLGVATMTTILPALRGSTPAGASAPAPGFTLAAGSWTLDELLRRARDGEVDAVSAIGGTSPLLIARTTAGSIEAVRSDVPFGDALDVIRAAGLGRLLTDEAIALDPTPTAGGVSTFVGLGMSVALLVLVVLVLARMRRSGGLRRWRPTRTSLGRRPRTPAGDPERPTVTLADVAGADEAKFELTETIEFLREPARFARLGATAIRGVLLYGPPGTGKTLLAKAVAAEADVPFFSVSGSEFVEKFVGVGAGRVRELFAKARAAGRAVIFIDEIDALAKSRGGNAHEEREQTLNQLLVEMDGFSSNDDIVVIGATNRLDTLDAAVLRPGRFTRKIHVPLPDREGRSAILAVHAKGKPLTTEVDLPALARKTYGFSGAMLADLLNESAIAAARSGQAEIGPGEVHAGWLKTALGTSRKRSMDERERSIIAAHEAGHAVCGFVHGDKRRVEEISLFAHGDALGVTVSSSEDNDLPSETNLNALLIALMGGRVAEELLFAEITGGASNDFERATSLATTMVVRFGMGRDPEATEFGITGRGILSTLVGSSSVGVNGEVRDAQARAIRSLLDGAYTKARDTLMAEMPRLRAVAGYLYEQERIDGDEFEGLMAGRLKPADPEDWRAAAASPRAWDTIEPMFTRRPVTAALPTASEVPAPGSARTPSPTPQTTPRTVTTMAPRGGRPTRRYPATRRLPALPTRLRRSLAAIVRELAEPGEV